MMGGFYNGDTFMLSIVPFQEKYTQDIIDLVLHFQNNGRRPPVTVDGQPDLLRIQHSYLDAGGFFWMTLDEEGKLAGTVGLMPCGAGMAVLKKFFVYEPYQGAPHHLGRQLYGRLLDFAKGHGVHTILLDTPCDTVRAHKFYERAGFRKVTKDELPCKYDPPIKPCDFSLLELQ